MKQAYSIHIDNLSTARQREAQTQAPTACRDPPVLRPCWWNLCQVLHTARASSQVHKKPYSHHRPQEQRLGPALVTGSVPQQSLGAPCSQACACTYVYMQTTPMLGQLELKNRLRHMLGSWSRQILRLFLKIVPLLLWHSCLELTVSGPIYKPPFSWQSWCKQEIPAKTVGLLSSMSISLPEQEPQNLASGRRHHSPRRDVCRHFEPLSREMRISSHFPCSPPIICWVVFSLQNKFCGYSNKNGLAH